MLFTLTSDCMLIATPVIKLKSKVVDVNMIARENLKKSPIPVDLLI